MNICELKCNLENRSRFYSSNLTGDIESSDYSEYDDLRKQSFNENKI